MIKAKGQWWNKKGRNQETEANQSEEETVVETESENEEDESEGEENESYVSEEETLKDLGSETFHIFWWLTGNCALKWTGLQLAKQTRWKRLGW